MFVQYDNTPDRSARAHPPTALRDDPGARYWNFCQQPDLIPKVLEDFVSWDHYPAVQRFYDLLRWLNSDESIFESNGSGLAVPRIETLTPQIVSDVFDAEPIGIQGRLTIFYRDLSLNTDQPSVEWLKHSLHSHLQGHAPDLPATVYIGERLHNFTATGKEGRAVRLRFWAWGADEMAAMQTLESTFDVLRAILQRISDAAKDAPPLVQRA